MSNADRLAPRPGGRRRCRLGGLLLAGCDRLSSAPPFLRACLESAEGLTYARPAAAAGRPAAGPRVHGRGTSRPVFKANGTTQPGRPRLYAQMAHNGFADWRLVVDGLVARPLSLSLADLRACRPHPDHPSRLRRGLERHRQVDRRAAWAGAASRPGSTPSARYIVFHCADDLGSTDGSGHYYESIDLIDAFHPQTILAYDLNDQPLPVAHGAPLRLRVERQLGYKQAKYVMRIEVVDRLDHSSAAARAASGKTAATSGTRGSSLIRSPIRQPSRARRGA